MNCCQILTGDCRELLPTLEAESVQCCVCSPPYWGLRDYGTAQWEGGDAECDHKRFNSYPSGLQGSKESTFNGKFEKQVCGKCGARRIDSQLGLEPTPEEYLANMVAVFRAVWRVLKPDGTLWVNMGDSYAHGIPGGDCVFANGRTDGREFYNGDKARGREKRSTLAPGLKPKDLCMMPARLAMALQADGWYLRSEIVWHKPNPMPESVTDRPTKAHEMIYLLAKNGGNPLIWRARDTGEWSYHPDLSQKIILDGEEEPRWKGFDYFYDAEAIREPTSPTACGSRKSFRGGGKYTNNNSFNGQSYENQTHGNLDVGIENRSKRSVWTIPTQAFPECHFATFPEEIPKLCILAGSKLGDTVLDPFAGSGTVGKVALEFGRRAILIELNPAYIELARDRTFITPGFL